MEEVVNEKREFKALIIYFAILFGASVIVSLGFSIKFGQLAPEKLNEYYGAYTAIYLLTYSILLLVIFWLLYHKKIKGDLKRINKDTFLGLIAYGIGFYVINMVLSVLFTSVIGATTSNQDALDSAISSLAIVTIIPTSFIVPLVEEIVFRYAMSTIIKNKVAFVIVSSLLFAVMHGIGIITILYFILGVMLSLIYLKHDKNVIASTAVHMFNNTVSNVLSLLL